MRGLPRLRRRRASALGGGPGRATLVRFGAPALFLAAVTAIVIVIRGSLRSDSPVGGTTSVVVTTVPATQTRPPVPKRFYVIRSGDTLGAIAGRFGTTVTDLLRLNPGVEPTALHPGRQIRVR